MKTIVACVDLSPASERVVAAAVELARPLAAALHLLHVAEPEPDFVGYDAGPQPVRNAVAHHLRDEHREIEALAEQLRASGLDAHPHTARGPFAETLLRRASELGADLVVVGSHGRGALKSLVLGSVSNEVIRLAHVPVVVVPVGERG